MRPRTVPSALLALGLSLALAPGAFGEDPKAPAPTGTQATPASGPQTTGGAAAPQDTETINKIMQDNEAMLSGRGFTYDPAGRRDPFRSLVDAANTVGKGPRPRGIAGRR